MKKKIFNFKYYDYEFNLLVVIAKVIATLILVALVFGVIVLLFIG